MKTHFLPLFFLAAVFMGCEKEKPWPAPPEVPEELVFEVFPEEENVIKDGDFSQADLSTDIVATTRFYSAWGYSNSIPDNTTIAIKDLGGGHGNVLTLKNGAEMINSASCMNAYVGQRVLAQAKPAVYALKFKARKTAETTKGTLRTFVLATGEDGAIVKNFFAVHGNQNNPYEPTAADKKYGVYGTHKVLTNDWTEYTVYINMGRTTTSTASMKFGDTKNATEEDLKGFVVCFSISDANAEIQIDDIDFSLVKAKEPEEPLTTPEPGVNVVKDSDFEKADLSNDVASVSPIIYGEWGSHMAESVSGYEFSIVKEGTNGNVLQIKNGESTVGSANLLNAYAGQRIYIKGSKDVYKLTFKARFVGSAGTARIFIPTTDGDEAVQKKFFIKHFADADPYSVTPADKKYTMFCYHQQLTSEWGEYTIYIDLRRTTTKTSSAVFGSDTAESTDVDLEKFLVCFSSSVANTTIQIDDVSFSSVGPKPAE